MVSAVRENRTCLYCDRKKYVLVYLYISNIESYLSNFNGSSPVNPMFEGKYGRRDVHECNLGIFAS